MENNMGEQLNLVINNLAEKLGVAVDAVDKVYPLVIKQAQIDGFVSLFWVVLGILLLIGSAWFINRYHVQKIEVERYGEIIKVKRSDDWEDLHVISFFINLLIIILGVGLIGSSIDNSVNALCNPEWYAIKSILSQIK